MTSVVHNMKGVHSQMPPVDAISSNVFMCKDDSTKTKSGTFILYAKYEAAVDAVLQSCIGLHMTRNTMHG